MPYPSDALAALLPALVEAIQRARPPLCAAFPVLLRLDTVGSYVLGAMVHHGEEGVVVYADGCQM